MTAMYETEWQSRSDEVQNLPRRMTPQEVANELGLPTGVVREAFEIEHPDTHGFKKGRKRRALVPSTTASF